MVFRSYTTSIAVIFSVPNAAPMNLMVSAVNGYTLSATWDPPSLQHRNGEIVHYVVNITVTARGDAQVTDGELQTLHTPAPNLTIESLHPYYTYFYSVAAESSVGVGPTAGTTITMPEEGYIMHVLYLCKLI